jgi:hypothetical protein
VKPWCASVERWSIAIIWIGASDEYGCRCEEHSMFHDDAVRCNARTTARIDVVNRSFVMRSRTMRRSGVTRH